MGVKIRIMAEIDEEIEIDSSDLEYCTIAEWFDCNADGCLDIQSHLYYEIIQ